MTVKKQNGGHLLLTLLGVLLFPLVSCHEYMPKPRGYFRIEPPEAVYEKLPVSDVPYSFDCSQMVQIDSVIDNDYGDLTLFYPDLNAAIYCSYIETSRENLEETVMEAECFLFSQNNIEAIQKKIYENPQHNLYGSMYMISGDCVSPLQFVLTDSVSRAFRGALYYNFRPREDSVAPATAYLQKDIIRIIETFRWKDKKR